MKDHNKKKAVEEELPFEKRAMEVILRILVIVTMTYFFMLIVIL